MSVLKIRGGNGNFIPIKSIKGESAYEQAKAGGYLGTEEEFIQALASLGGEYALQTINDGYDEHIDDRNNPHKVTAEQVGALPLTGGIMKSSIKWNEGKTHIVGQADGNFIIQNYKTSEEGNDDFIAFHNTMPLKSVLRIFRNGVPYSVYGTHNKPTASDVGAVSKNGDTIGNYFVVSKESAPLLDLAASNSLSRLVKNANSEDDDGLYITDFADKNSPEDRLSFRVCHKVAKESLKDAVGIIFIENDAGAYYRMFGEHNKPTVTYNGNGGSQTIQVGGMGAVAWLIGANGVQGFVSKNGFLGMNSNGQMSNQDSNYLTFENGVLTLKLNGLCNASNTAYTIQVL